MASIDFFCRPTYEIISMFVETHPHSHHFMGTEILLPCKLEPQYCSFPEPNESTPLPLILFLKPIVKLCFLITLDSLFILVYYVATLSVPEVKY